MEITLIIHINDQVIIYLKSAKTFKNNTQCVYMKLSKFLVIRL